MKKRKHTLIIVLFILLFAAIGNSIEEQQQENSIENPSFGAEDNNHSVISTFPAERPVLPTLPAKQPVVPTFPVDQSVQASDAYAYYEQNSNIIAVIDAQASAAVLTEAETYSTLTDLGFTQFPITASYSMNGAYYDAEEITGNGSAKHPIYETYYFTSKGEVWTIFMINGAVMANPVSYNLQSNLGAQVMLSASETVMSYDSATNTFFETVPKSNALFLLIAERIDASLLEMLTIEEIDRYVY